MSKAGPCPKIPKAPLFERVRGEALAFSGPVGAG